MTKLWTIAAAAGLFALSTAVSQSQTRNNAQQVVATVGGVDLTLGDLRGAQGGKLLQAEFQYYVSERKALDELIDSRLLASEARKRGMTLDQLLDTVVYQGVTDPTEDQLRVYYEGLETQESFDTVKDEVLHHIRELRRNKARTAFVDRLRKDAKIDIALMPPSADVNTSKAYGTGPGNAPVVLVEFADYQCPYCQKVNPQIERLKKEYGSELAVVFKDFPLPMHHMAQKAAEASRCAGVQGKFWEYHDVLFYSNDLGTEALKDHARVLKLNTEQFDSCLDNGAEAAAVRADLDEAKSLGLTGTPSFFVNGHFFSGVVDYGVLKSMIDQQLSLAKNKQSMMSKK